jgi:hypothetical protein
MLWLEIPGQIGHIALMDQAIDQSPPGWAEALARGAAELARGELVPASDVHDLIRTALTELDSDMSGDRKDPTRPLTGR